ncbi:hypothetical protein NEUTE1DRAFT_38488 [Neurospora tetrasperma FGSC 2508]|uniref:F-box domain-containing protein n=1 Tax=Neurospora tetrasperma (strain FGSC 2508 / ATCC MYA-4615 / P0657) TaxID=510951 RepID=F8MJF5_NEUT8|nr:uncharacterized protein NEUTE1DRAFT_38488 [Neurospora tetrasperma FGSC 2508]EGO59946.1 hypothetical protein NEUTE1DRAFT_38488 [Neurospora tetrasperma FGSC 2508]EGZ74096.1 hypothetical protein NEUTE2DRAFT_59423 [Neurospora tetrasperma FGSC 2509]
MVLLTQLPSEIINNIFGYVAPDDLPSIRSICRRLTEHVKGNAVLHRDIYYRHLDEPPEDVDWEQSLNDLAKLRRLCGREYENFEVSCPNIHMPKMTFVYHAVTNLLKAIPPSSSLSAARSGEQHNTPQQPISSSYSPSRNAAILSNLFSKESVRNAFLQGSQLYERAHCFDYLPIPMRTIIDLERSRYVRIPVYIEYQQQSAKMHCHFGVGVQAPATLTLPNNPALSSSLNMNPYPPPTPGTNAHATPPSPPLPTRDGQLRSAFFGRTSLVPRLYPYAVSKVYDLREYTTRSKWGPFRADGSGKVDWEKVEAILLVLRTNIKLKELDRIPMVGNVWNTPFAGCWEGSLCRLPRAGDNGNNSSSTTTTDGDGQGQQGQGQGQAGGGGGPMGVGSGYAGWFLWGNNTNTQHEDWDSDVANDGAVDDMEGEEEEDGDNSDGDFAGEEEKEENRDMKLEMEDPYGVSGVWLRVVCFLDYTDFFSFNFPDDNMPCPESVPRPPLDVGEATKLLMMKIHVNRIVYPEPGTEIKGKIWPIVHWRGYARSFDGSPGEARLTWGLRGQVVGVVQMTPEGEVRWTTSSLYDGEERWRSEGIQIGGVKSARGVVGNWFDKDYNPHGPCGPTAFWKISDLEAVRPRGGHGGGQ